MTEHSRVSAQDAPRRGAGRRTRRKKRQPPHRYFAFLSYSHKDEDLADWLHRELEDFRVPAALVGKITDHGVVPRRLTPVFRDQHELAAADDLTEEIEQALAGSQCLIVLCSPNAASSHWTNAEVEAFKRRRPDGCVLAAIGAGEPFASEIDGRGNEECFPPALRQKYDRLGRPTGKRAEPLAADLRGDGRRIGFLKLVAGMLGVGLDDLVQRENTRRQRRLAWLAAASISGMALTSLLAFTAIRARDAARDQRREAEGLVAFMLGDLKDKLEPIGRLDALDGVGAKVLDYYRRQDTRDLPDDALLQRSKALSLSAQVASLRGDLGTAERLYNEAAEGTAETVRRAPSDPERLFEHAQNIYYLSDIASQRGDYDRAAKGFEQYRALADRMTAIGPDNLRWRMEVQYAATNLGIVQLKRRHDSDAAEQFQTALATIEAIAQIEPRNIDYQRSRAETLAWLADAEANLGRLPQAIEHRQQQIALLDQLISKGDDVTLREMLIPTRIKLGKLFAAQGSSMEAQTQFNQALTIADSLVAKEPDNRKWLEYAAFAKLSLAFRELQLGQLGEAQHHNEEGCAIVGRLLARDPDVAYWKMDQRTCLTSRTQIALASRRASDALTAARTAVNLSTTIRTDDPVADRFAGARAYRLLGDALLANGQSAPAHEAWAKGLSILPQGGVERPSEAEVRAELLQRTGEQARSAQILGRLRSQGVRSGEILGN
jgi:tetratricopeptide (TPR) repeat protein